MKKRVLIACEFSGTVRDEFSKIGWDAWSCDLLPSETPGNHIQGDVLEIVGRGWDLMIGHPPCTFILNSGCKHLYKDGKRWLSDGTENPRCPERWANMVAGAKFFRALWDAPVNRVCLESPIMVGHAKAIIGIEQAQTVQPWQFGHGETKATCLWLRGLPPIQPTDIVPGREHRIHKMRPGSSRSHERSRTYPGIAKAMAEQWTKHIDSL